MRIAPAVDGMRHQVRQMGLGNGLRVTNLLTIHCAPHGPPPNARGRCSRGHRANATSRTSMAWKRSSQAVTMLIRKAHNCW
jgi:hypothetical protein